MLRTILKGVMAGAAGTVALNIATYVDMAVRGRSSSNAPAKLISTVTDKIGLCLILPNCLIPHRPVVFPPVQPCT